jgi:F420-0:gamma-glutamyl ligase
MSWRNIHKSSAAIQTRALLEISGSINQETLRDTDNYVTETKSDVPRNSIHGTVMTQPTVFTPSIEHAGVDRSNVEHRWLLQMPSGNNASEPHTSLQLYTRVLVHQQRITA